MTHKTIQPDGWAPALGYANGILTKDGTLHIGGQIGWNKDKVFESKEFVPQMHQALQNISDIVVEAGGKTSYVVRLTWFVTDKATYVANQRAVGAAYRTVFGKHFPAMSMLVVAGLIEDDALVEIEATAQLT
jgi:enamine deaminase RidA (YjgF/YER057c/UK114 family)